MYRFKLKEIEVGDTDTKGGKKSTVTDVNPETGAITWDVKDVADFTSTYKELEKAKDFLSKLEKIGYLGVATRGGRGMLQSYVDFHYKHGFEIDEKIRDDFLAFGAGCTSKAVS